MQLDRQVYIRAEQFLPWNVQKLVFKVDVAPRWIDKGSRFWYCNKTRDGKEFVLVDPAHQRREPAFDHVRLAAALSQAAGSAYDPDKLPFDSITFADEGRAVSFEVGDARWTCNLETYALSSEEKKPKPEDELPSPDGKWAAFARKYDLYVRNTESGEEIALTHDGRRYDDYGTQPESRTSAVTEKLAGTRLPPVAIWSPDSKKLLTHKLDQRRVKDLYLLQHVPPDGSARPVLHSYRYPLVGDKEVSQAKFAILDVEQKTQVAFKTETEDVPFMSPISLGLAWWGEDSQAAYLVHMDRSHRTMSLIEVDARTGDTRTVIEEHGETHIEAHLQFEECKPNIRVLGKGAEIIWFSQRDGWAHLYLYDGRTGALKNQITTGTYVVRDILYVDETGRWVYFTAGGREAGEDPYFRHLYRARLDGSEVQLLAPEDADHTITFSPDGSCFVDTYSRIDMAPVTVLRQADGELILELERADVDLLLATGWRWPERFCVKARDGVTDIHGAIYRPADLDPGKQYPVLDAIYPGPQIIRTPKSFTSHPLYSSFFWEQQALAELGFIVVTIDGLGTPLRSKAFHDVSYGNLHEAGGLEDHIAGFRQLAARYPYMDLNRVGIYGHSGGGFASTRAILAYPDFYKVAVSSAGNHDQRSYVALWGEKYQGLLEGDNYDKQANSNLAHNLKGKLLLVYGDMDDNVHPTMTIQVIDALIKANKDFDMLVLPNRNHSFMLDTYFIRKRWDYFVEHLLGLEPPEGYCIQPPA